MIVVDASVAVKWYVLEQSTAKALDLLKKYQGHIEVPDIFIIEVTGALVRRANIDKSLRSECEVSINRFTMLFDNKLIISQRATDSLLTKASKFALDLGHPLKDCVYLALAMELDCELVTCDVKFAEKARSTAAKVRVLDK